MASFSVDANASSPSVNDSEPTIEFLRATRQLNPVYTSHPLPEYLRLIDPIELEDDGAGQQPAEKRVKLAGGICDSSSNSTGQYSDSGGGHAEGADRPKDILNQDTVIELEELIISDDEYEIDYSAFLGEEDYYYGSEGHSGNENDQLSIVQDSKQDENVATDSLADGPLLEPSPPILEAVGQEDLNEAENTHPQVVEQKEPDSDVDSAVAVSLERLRIQKEAF